MTKKQQKNEKLSKIERSQHREQIDKWIAQGKGDTEILRLIPTLKPPFKIGRTALYNYKKNKFNINKEATIRYHEKKSKEQLNEAVEKTVSDLEFLDDIIEKARQVKLKVDNKKDITPLDIKKIGIQAVRAKMDVFKSGNIEDREFKIKIVSVDSDERNNLEAKPETEE